MIKKIVLTGGPGSGKTTVIEQISKTFTEKGYKVITVDETASYLINMGIRPFGDTAISMVDFQEIVLKMQLAKENVIARTIELLPESNVLIIYDRGAMDNRAYVNQEEFNDVLNRLNYVTSITELMSQYDLVINLVSRADFYTLDNNPARTEGVKEALELGDKTIQSWLGHKNIKIVLPEDNIEDKIANVLNIINGCLCEREVKRQEKFLVDLSNIDFSQNPSKQIEQTYLISEPNVEKRIRKENFNGYVTHLLTIYRTTQEGKKELVSEEAIDERIYHKLMDFKDPSRQTIHKQRYYYAINGEYFHIDKFDDNNQIGILEINVFENEESHIPEDIPIISVVSDNKAYSNYEIATKSKPVVKTLLPRQ